jgi:hypothetical protein
VSGPETYCITPVGAASSNAQGEGANYGATTANFSERKSLLLAYQVQRSLVKNLGAEDRGVRRARFAVLRDAAMPAILIESGYMTHPVEGQKDFRRGLPEADCGGDREGDFELSKIDGSAVASPGGADEKSGQRTGGKAAPERLVKFYHEHCDQDG